MPSFGTGKSCISPVFGLSRVILFPIPKFGIQIEPSFAGAALNGMRLGPGMSYSTYAIFIASLVNGRSDSLYPGASAADFGRTESSTIQFIQIRRNFRGILIREPLRQTEMHGLAHELHAIGPAIRIARHRSHARLKPVADKAACVKMICLA